MSDKFTQLGWAFLLFILVFASLLALLGRLSTHFTNMFVKKLLKSRIKVLYLLLCLFQKNNILRHPPTTLLDKNIIKFITITTLIAFVTSKLSIILIKPIPKLLLRVDPKTACSLLTFFYYRASAWLFLCGDVELNPGPPLNDYLKFMHWNANSLPAHNFARIPLIQLYNAINDFSLIAISETALKNEIPNEKIEIPGYCPIKCDLANDDSHCGVMIYHKENMAVKNRSDLFDHTNSLVLELSIAQKKVFFYPGL